MDNDDLYWKLCSNTKEVQYNIVVIMLNSRIFLHAK
jgi:hypothetical protein